MTQFSTKYHQAQLWIEQFQAREEKKQALNTTNSVPQSLVATEDTHAPHVVFTKADVGHNQKETEKIQELYHELEDAPHMPVFAFA